MTGDEAVTVPTRRNDLIGKTWARMGSHLSPELRASMENLYDLAYWRGYDDAESNASGLATLLVGVVAGAVTASAFWALVEWLA